MSDGLAPSETHDQFVQRMIAEGASPEAALQAADGHFRQISKDVPPGQLLPGPSAHAWQLITFVWLGCFIAILASVLFTAPAFHPTESARESALWVTLFFATFFPILALMFGSGLALIVKSGREQSKGYTTLRWLRVDSTEIRDGHGDPILPGDRRLATSAKCVHAFIAIGSACGIVSPAIWLVRLFVQ